MSRYLLVERAGLELECRPVGDTSEMQCARVNVEGTRVRTIRSSG